MYSDATRTGRGRIQHHDLSCHCSGDRYGSPYPGGPDYPRPPQTPAPARPPLDPERDAHPSYPSQALGTDFGPGREGGGGHRNPRRRPVFAGPGPHARPEDFGPGCPWDSNPAQWSYPAAQQLAHRQYPPAQGGSYSGCVARGEAGTRSLHARRAPQTPVSPPQFKGQMRPRHVNDWREPDHCWGCGDAEHPPSDSRVPELRHLPSGVANGRRGPHHVFAQGGEGRDRHLDWDPRRGGSEGSCCRHIGSPKGFFATEVPQKAFDHPKRRTAPSSDLGVVSAGAPQGKEPPPQTDRRGGQGSVREQIQQVVTDLEGVLGGLKQVHVEMKEVVQQIDRLTANIDLGGEGPGPGLPLDAPPPGAVSGVPGYTPRANGDAVPPRPHRQTGDPVLLRTDSPSPVLVASVVKTSRVVPPSPLGDPRHHRRGVNGHAPAPPPLRDADHVTRLDPDPPRRTRDPTVVVGNSTSLSRSQKPPPYPHNGRAEKGGKGTALAPPLHFLRTPPYPAGKCRQTSSMV